KDFALAAGNLDQPAAETLQARLDHLVIIVAARIDRYAAAGAPSEDRQRVFVWTVIDAKHDDRAHGGPHRARVAAPVGFHRHPCHVAVAAGVEELPQSLGGFWDRIRPRDADDVEALAASSRRECGLERRRCQKSRL